MWPLFCQNQPSFDQDLKKVHSPDWENPMQRSKSFSLPFLRHIQELLNQPSCFGWNQVDKFPPEDSYTRLRSKAADGPPKGSLWVWLAFQALDLPESTDGVGMKMKRYYSLLQRSGYARLSDRGPRRSRMP